MGFTPHEASQCGRAGYKPKENRIHAWYRCCVLSVSHMVTRGSHTLTHHRHHVSPQGLPDEFVKHSFFKSICIPPCSAAGSGSTCSSWVIPGAEAQVLLGFQAAAQGGRCDSRCCSRVLDLPPPSCLQHKCNDVNILLHLVLFYKKDWKVKKS